VVYERALNRWQRVMPLEMLGLPTLLGEKARLTSVVICNGLIKNLGNHTQEGFNLNVKRISLKAHMLKHSLLH
jgi:hypothetical protein